MMEKSDTVPTLGKRSRGVDSGLRLGAGDTFFLAKGEGGCAADNADKGGKSDAG